MPDGERYPICFGPYLRYAIDSDFENFSTDFEDFGKKFQFFDEDRFRLLLLVELKQPEFVDKFESAMGARDEFGTEFGPDVGNTRYVTMRCRKAAVTNQFGAFRIWREFVSRVELSLPVRPSSPGTRNRKADLVERYDEGKDSPGSLLIGMLDDGCPFAAAHFLETTGAVSTRVRGIWDQNQDKQPVTINGRDFGMELTDFGYGLEYRRDFSSALAPGKIGLDDWIGLHSTPQNSIDEDHCYAEADFTRLKSRESHGAHVMDVLAGRIPTSSRIGPLPPGDRRDPPSWRPGTDAASSAEVVFVQFSEDNIRDATGVWLPTYVVQGIQYVLSFATPSVTERVIINLSYGPTTGPHDGTALLEEALTALVAYYDGTGGRPKLEIFLAAGNSYLTEGHVVFRRHDHNQPDHVEWIWRLPPDNTVLCFCEVWMKTVHAGSVSVTLTSPSGQTLAGVPIAWSSDDTMWLLRVKPTIASTGLVAEHGDYTISVAGVPHHHDADVHAYVARSDPNMGVRTGAKLSHFVDPEWERTRSAEASCKYDNGEFDKTGSLIDRYGTLNGIATAKDDSVHVAGGYIVANQRKSTYSSAGPARPDSPRLGPDYLLPCDESYALQGIRAGGNRSGSVFRLIGTSTAAPQLARHVADPPIPPAHDIPGTLIEEYKRGGGNIDPP
ncbi:hypothetical protein ACF1BQ_003760 [Bradyrhizobium sp. RDT10]